MLFRYSIPIVLFALCRTIRAVSTMRAVIQPIPSGDLIIGTIDIPEVKDRDILIKVDYAALNRMDLLQAKGLYPLPPGTPETIGVEVAGTVSRTGTACQSGLQVGDSVMALLLGGGYAEYAVADERTVMRIAPSLDKPRAASIPEAFMTAYQLLFWVGQLKRGETVLLHAAASSIGQAAIQLAVSHGARVIATTRSQDKVALCQQLGAHATIVVGNDSMFADAAIAANDGREVDVILDPVGAAYLTENVRAVEFDGKIVMYGLLSGGNVTDPQFLKKLLFKRAALLPSTLRARDYEYKSRLINDLMTDAGALPAVVSGAIKVEVDSIFAMDDVMQAHKMMANNDNAGKILLAVSEAAIADLVQRPARDL